MGDLPSYQLPDPWPHGVFFIDEKGKNIVQLKKQQRRVTLPEFELFVGPVPTPKEAERLVHLEVLRLMANFCVSVSSIADMTSGMVLMPIRSDVAINSPDGWIGSTQLCLMATHDFDDITRHHYDWIPREIPDIEYFAANLEKECLIMGVMTE